MTPRWRSAVTVVGTAFAVETGFVEVVFAVELDPVGGVVEPSPAQPYMQKELAFDWLEKAFADHSYDLLFLKLDEKMDSIRSDPRFADLLRRMNLQP
jgi:hypothetical protein